MTTSGSYSFSVERDDIIRQAMLNIGKLDPFEAPDAQQKADCAFVLNMMCKQWMGKADFAPGLKVWTRKHGHLFLNNSTGTYTIGPQATGWTNSYVYPVLTAATGAGAAALTVSSAAGIAMGYYFGVQQTDGSLFWSTVLSVAGLVVTLNDNLTVGSVSGGQVFAYQTTAQQPLFIETATLRDQNLNDVPVSILATVQDYDILSSKASGQQYSMDPTAIYYENQLGNSLLYTDAGAAQDVTKHLALTYMEPVQDLINPTDSPYYPQEYYLPLCWGLSKLICPMFNRVWTTLMEDNYKAALAIAQQKDAEVSTIYFQPGID
jgi:hypothetical protein